jgi:aryl-alcohol dehydrogenase-like predicted oxidoreductase
MVHQPYSFSTPEAEMRAMAELVQQGKIRSVGVSNFSAAQMRRAHAELAKFGLPLAANQVYYSLLHRQIETDGILETARELGVTIIAYTPLEAGLLSGKYHTDPALLQRSGRIKRFRFSRRVEACRPVVEALLEMAPRYAATAAQVALNWLIYAQGDLVVTIPGATKVYQAQDAGAAMRFRLEAADLSKLDALTRQYR